MRVRALLTVSSLHCCYWGQTEAEMGSLQQDLIFLLCPQAWGAATPHHPTLTPKHPTYTAPPPCALRATALCGEP